LKVKRVTRQEFLASDHEFCQQSGCLFCFGAFSLEHIGTEGLSRDVVGRSAVKTLVSASYDKQMAILDSRIEMDTVRT